MKCFPLEYSLKPKQDYKYILLYIVGIVCYSVNVFVTIPGRHIFHVYCHRNCCYKCNKKCEK